MQVIYHINVNISISINIINVSTYFIKNKNYITERE